MQMSLIIPNTKTNVNTISSQTISSFKSTARDSSRSWRGVASSYDGVKLVAVVSNGQIYTSTDMGVTWTARDSNRNWIAVASSYDGIKLVAVVNNGQIYTSINSGVSWTARDSSRVWQSVASSYDGTKLVATVYGGQIYTSIDSGATWTARDSNRNWTYVGSNADGTILVAGIDIASSTYYSINSGVTWTLTSTNINTTGIAISARGTTIVLTGAGGTYQSTNTGTSWTQINNSVTIQYMAGSYDCTRLIGAISSSVYTSFNGGVTWTLAGSIPSVQGVACSGDGTRVVVTGTQIYTVLNSTNGTINLNPTLSSLTTNSTYNLNAINIRSPFIASSSAITATNTSTLYIQGPPSVNANITNTNLYSLNVAYGSTILSGNGGSTGSSSSLFISPVTTLLTTNTYFTYLDQPITSGTGTTASTLYIAGAPTGGTISLSHALNIADGSLAFTASAGTNLNGIRFITTNVANPSTSTTNTPGRILLNDNPIYIRNDQNHYLCFGNISGTTYNGVTKDGPALIGYGGGILGTVDTGLNWSLIWNNDGSVSVRGAFSKGSGTFKIDHPDPSKNKDYYLRHSFVESPTAGDNIYRYQVHTENNTCLIELPSYFKFLNKDVQVLVTPVDSFASAYGTVNDIMTHVVIQSNTNARFNVLIIGTRKDELATSHWENNGGAEPLKSKCPN